MNVRLLLFAGAREAAGRDRHVGLEVGDRPARAVGRPLGVELLERVDEHGVLLVERRLDLVEPGHQAFAGSSRVAPASGPKSLGSVPS